MDSNTVIKEEMFIKNEKEGTPASSSADSFLDMSLNSERQRPPTTASLVPSEPRASSAAIDEVRLNPLLTF
jgi:hypothetical protein